MLVTAKGDAKWVLSLCEANKQRHTIDLALNVQLNSHEMRIGKFTMPPRRLGTPYSSVGHLDHLHVNKICRR
jgi:hypothetical protein